MNARKRWVVAALCFGVALTAPFVLLRRSTLAQPTTCPTDVFACLGAAAQFGTVGQLVRISAFGSGYYAYGAEAEGALCAETGRFSGTDSDDTDLFGDVILTAGAGRTAGSFRGVRDQDGERSPGAYVHGDLVTGGGKVRGLPPLFGYGYGNVTVEGVTDTTGVNPKLAPCQQAWNDIHTASAALKALTPTQQLGKVVLKGNDFTVTGVSGVNVISAESIVVRPSVVQAGHSITNTPAHLNIHLPDDTSVAVINVAKSVYVGAGCTISPDVGRVIINVYGTHPVVTLKSQSLALAVLLAPNGKVSSKLSQSFPSPLGSNDFSSGGGNFFARSVTVKGVWY